MNADMFLLYVIAALFGVFGWHSCVFVNSAATSVAERNTAAATAKNAISGLLSYPASDSTYMNPAATGSISFRPRESGDYSSRAAVYDPGDELLKAVNDELVRNGLELGERPEEPDYAETVFNELEIASHFDILRKLEKDLREEQEVVSKSALLMKLLEDPTIETLPVVYVEDDAMEDSDDNALYEPLSAGQMAKRSRYYRRYPWKRHNRHRSTYEPELRYACTPSKEDVFKLLVNLHENRKGNHGKTVNFCNRKRPAKAIFTNIRFLG